MLCSCFLEIETASRCALFSSQSARLQLSFVVRSVPTDEEQIGEESAAAATTLPLLLAPADDTGARPLHPHAHAKAEQVSMHTLHHRPSERTKAL